MTETDQQGRFSFSTDPVGPENYTLYARSPDGRFEYVDNATLTRSANWLQLHINLMATSQATGKILDHDGKPLAGLTLKPTTLHFGDYMGQSQNEETGLPMLWTRRTRSLYAVPEFLQAYWTVTTDADGTFTIPSLPYQCALEAKLVMKPEANLILLLNSRVPADIRLPKPGRVLVRQLDEDASLSFKGAEISCSSVTEEASYMCFQHLKGTMVNAPLVFERVYAGMQTTISQMTFGESPAYLEKPQVIEAVPGQSAEVVLKARAGVTIKGRVIHEETNKPLSQRQEVTIVNDEAKQGPRSKWDSTNNEGYYQGFSTPGTNIVFLILPEVGPINDHRCPPVTQKGKAGQTITMPDLVLKPGKTIEGEVVNHDGKPVPQAHLYSFVTERSRLNLLTDAQGKFTINNLAEDEIVLFAHSEEAVVAVPLVVNLASPPARFKLMPNPRYPLSNEQWLTVYDPDPQQKIKLTLDPQANFFIAGRFVNGLGKQLAALPVHLEWSLRGTGQQSRVTAKKQLMNTATDAEGRFRFGPLWPGQTYLIKNQSNELSGYESASIIGKAGETQDLGTIEMKSKTEKK